MKKGVSVNIKPEIIRWAVECSRLSADTLRLYSDWQQGISKPTLPQLTKFAKNVHVPLGYLFLTEPPIETIPIQDYRTFDGKFPQQPSPNLLDTIYEMQRRQDWMKEYLAEAGTEKLPFVKSLNIHLTLRDTVDKLRKYLGLPENWSTCCNTKDKSISMLRERLEQTGILVSISGIVGMSPNRPLDTEEFCGFALADDYAPLIFINGRCTKSSQIFTLIHETVHIGLGQSGIFNQLPDMTVPQKDVEKFCDQVAAEFLVPEAMLKKYWKSENDETLFENLSSIFKVSPLVIARRALDLQLITKEQFFPFWKKDRDDWENNLQFRKNKNGGNAYRNYKSKLGLRFSEAVISAVESGFLSYRDAYRLTGLNGETFDKYVKHLQR